MDPVTTLYIMSSTLKLFEEFAPQFRRAFGKTESVPPTQPATTEIADNHLLVTTEDKVVGISVADLGLLSDQRKKLITTLGDSVNKHFELWNQTFQKSIAAAADEEISEKYRAKLFPIAKEMCSDLEQLLELLRILNKPLDEHYKHIRVICSQPQPAKPQSTWRKAMSSNTVKIVLAIIAFLGIVIPAYWQFVYKPSHASDETDYTGRVLNQQTGKPVASAKVSLELNQGAPQIIYSDTEGVFHFRIAGSPTVVRVRVDAETYEGFDRNVSLNRSGLEDIRLKPKATEPVTPPQFGLTYPQNPTLEQVRLDLEQSRHVKISYSAQCRRTVQKTIVQLNGAQINASGVKEFLEQVAPRTSQKFFVKTISEGAAYEIVCQ